MSIGLTRRGDSEASARSRRDSASFCDRLLASTPYRMQCRPPHVSQWKHVRVPDMFARQHPPVIVDVPRGVYQLSKVPALELIDPKLPAALLICRKRNLRHVRSRQVPMSLADADSSSPRYPQQADMRFVPGGRLGMGSDKRSCGATIKMGIPRQSG